VCRVVRAERGKLRPAFGGEVYFACRYGAGRRFTNSDWTSCPLMGLRRGQPIPALQPGALLPLRFIV
jgi:hypothetical protein